jgi:hypothetical protein
MGCLATAILVLNNLRDIDTDAAAGKRTLATRIGRERTRILLVALICMAFAIPVLVVLLELASVTVLLVALAIPIAVLPVRFAYATVAGPPLVRALKRIEARGCRARGRAAAPGGMQQVCLAAARRRGDARSGAARSRPVRRRGSGRGGTRGPFVARW